jgi:hypothetical protein
MENTKKGYELRDRASEPERLYIESHYYEDFTGDLEKGQHAFELWAQMYPRDAYAWRGLGWVSGALRQNDRAFCGIP